MGKNNQRDIICRLRREGKKYKEISEILDIRISLISYYLKHDENLEKSRERNKRPENKESNKRSVQKIKLRNRNIVVNYLKKHPCVDCGNTDIRVLQFDHVIGKKIDSVSVGVKDSWSVEKLLKEINKCEVRCANCHKIITDIRRKNKLNNN